MRANQVVFEVGGVVLSSRLIDGQFPNYRQLLPEAYEHELTVSREELLEVVRRISLMAQKNAPLRLQLRRGRADGLGPDARRRRGERAAARPVRRRTVRDRLQPGLPHVGLESAGADEVVLKLISPLRPGLHRGRRRQRLPVPDHADPAERLIVRTARTA